jgi:hypothetical protein
MNRFTQGITLERSPLLKNFSDRINKDTVSPPLFLGEHESEKRGIYGEGENRGSYNERGM